MLEGRLILPHTGGPASASRLRASTYRAQLRVMGLLTDITAIWVSFLIVNAADYYHASMHGTALVITVIYVAAAASLKGYSMDLIHSSRSSSAAIRAFALSAGMMTLIMYFMRVDRDLSRVLLLLALGLTAVLLIVGRQILARVAASRLGERLWTQLLVLDRATPVTASGVTVIDAEAYGIAPDLDDPAGLDRFGRLSNGFDRVIIACPREARESWALMLKGANVIGEVIVEELGQLQGLALGTLGEWRTVQVASGPLTLSQRVTKRAFDLALTLPALIALLPLFGLIALAVKIDSRGPVFFRQRRIGRGNAFFEILKFRSMHVEHADAGGHRSTSGRSDPRVTRVGRFIRSTSLDELPQLLNVVGGSMSLVGPRPHALGSLAGDSLFWEVDQRYWERHACKPGLTGLAQVRGHRGATHHRDDLVKRLQSDLEYLSGWSISRDVSILFGTLGVLIHPRAY